MSTIPVAVQMYTLRDETAKDFIGTLRRVAEIGYAGVEFAGYGGLSAAELKAVLDDLQLRAAGTHLGLDALETDPDAVLDYQLAIGNHFITVPWMPAPADLAGWKEAAARLNAAGEQCKQRGIQLCYHNHAHEFALVDGVPGLDVLYANTDPALVQAQLDLYWVKKAGYDPASYVKKYAGRVPELHIKDMADDADGSFTEFGTGIIDWDAVFAAAPAAGVQWYIVEQDVCQRPCLESVEISFRNLRARGMA